MEISNSIAAVEAILFASGEPVLMEKLAQACEIEKNEMAKIIDQLERRYNVSEGGLRIIRLGNAYQITTREEYSPYIKAVLESKKQAPLSQAGLEVLAIIAYNQPVTKAFVEQVRGVDSGSIVNSLVEKGLLTESGRLDLPGRPVVFRTTDVFLRCFGLSDLSELPSVSDIEEEQLGIEESLPLEIGGIE